MDLSKVTMDDLLPITPVGGDTVNEEIDDSTQSERDPKDNSVVLAQPAVELHSPGRPKLCSRRPEPNCPRRPKCLALVL